MHYGKKEVVYYQVPDKYWHRLHFVRPRFKSNIENVLLYMANECCRIPKSSCEEYSRRYFEAIRMFPGNIDMADKTLHNWRTEIPALFGFYKENKEIDVTETSEMAKSGFDSVFEVVPVLFPIPGRSHETTRLERNHI